MPEPWVFLPADTLSSGYPRRRPEFVTIELDRRLRMGTMLAVRGFLDAGLNVIAAQGLWDSWARPVAARIFAPYQAFVLQLRCDVAVREAREGERPEIRPGFTRWQEDNQSWDIPHDFALDSAGDAPAALALRVAAWLRTTPRPTAFTRMVTAPEMTNHTQASNVLARLQRWFASCADGEWEHAHGISVETLDNPGWVLSVDLAETALQGQQFEERQVERTEQDWYHCRIEGTFFRGYGGPPNLEEMIALFLEWAETVRHG